MVKAVRRKRASEDSLYQSCLQGGYCPPDIKDKYENNTLADKILKWVSSFLYFGTLGIGTGRGTGGSTGYTPLGGGVRPGRGPNVSRPNVIIDAIGPQGIPVDSASPDSAIIPLLTDSSVTDSIPGLPTGEIEVIAEIHPPPTDGDPVIIGHEDPPPVLEVTPETVPTARTRVTSSKHNNPAFNAFVSATPLPGETSVSDSVHFIHGFVGETVGGGIVGDFEEIPLLDFNTSSADPVSSTPVSESSFTRIRNRFERRLYNRRLTQQVKVTNRKFLTQPSQLVQWEFDNPSFDSDVSLLFEQDLQSAAAPDPDFQDIVTLSRPFVTSHEGYVRVSRFGRRGTIRTRSGTQIGGHVHYYTDLSPINPAEDVEMHTLGRHPGESSILQPLAESSLIDSNTSDMQIVFGPEEEPLLQESFPDSDLEDLYVEDFRNSRLEVTGSGSKTTIVAVPDSIPPGSVKVFLEDIGSVVTHRDKDPRQPDIIYPTVDPAIIIDFTSSSATFYLHPSLLRKRRHKRHLF